MLRSFWSLPFGNFVFFRLTFLANLCSLREKLNALINNAQDCIQRGRSACFLAPAYEKYQFLSQKQGHSENGWLIKLTSIIQGEVICTTILQSPAVRATYRRYGSETDASVGFHGSRI